VTDFRIPLDEPGALAVVDAHGGLTYGDFDRVVSDTAAALRAAGAGSGATVLVATSRRREVVAALFAVLRAGAAYVPVDLEWPANRIDAVVADSAAAIGVVADGDPSALSGRGLAVFDAASRSWHSHASRESGPVSSASLAYVLYTSGSTGQPKGVEVPRTALAALFARNAWWTPIRRGDVALCSHSLTFDFSVWEVFRPLLAGATLVLADRTTMADPRRTLDVVESNRVTHLCRTPTALRGFVARALESPDRLRSLRSMIIAGEPVYHEDVREWFAAFGDDEPEVWNGYGPTETTVFCTAHRMRLADADRGRASIIGRSLGHATVALEDVDAEGVGEIVIGGPAVAAGYRNRPELTARSFVDGPGGRRYRSGDFARAGEDGSLEFLGRRDGQVKVRGYRVELEEVEFQLRRDPSVVQCVAVASPDSVLAGVVPANGGAFDERRLRLFAGTRLPAYMRPARIVRLDGVPTSSSGKVDRCEAARVIDEAICGVGR
jgi:amino acid adenylation domain-containing protein